jgi:hypothetical protein
MSEHVGVAVLARREVRAVGPTRKLADRQDAATQVTSALRVRVRKANLLACRPRSKDLREAPRAHVVRAAILLLDEVGNRPFDTAPVAAFQGLADEVGAHTRTVHARSVLRNPKSTGRGRRWTPPHQRWSTRAAPPCSARTAARPVRPPPPPLGRAVPLRVAPQFSLRGALSGACHRLRGEPLQPPTLPLPVRLRPSRAALAAVPARSMTRLLDALLLDVPPVLARPAMGSRLRALGTAGLSLVAQARKPTSPPLSVRGMARAAAL